MVPEVGRESIPHVRQSIEGMAEFTERLIETGATTVILISPHAPLDMSAFVAYPGPKVNGDFSSFRAPTAQVDAPVDEELLQAITQNASEKDYQVLSLTGNQLDHGTAVPLYFLHRNGWTGRVVALGYSFLGNDDHLRFGECIRRAADELGRPVAFVASGDLSHRLKLEAPAGYDHLAYLFDEEVVEAIKSNSPEKIIDIDPELRGLAGECGYRSMLVALGATRDLPKACEVLSYEAPFGVGYLVAQLTKQTSEKRERTKTFESDTEPPDHDPTQLARHAIETFVQTGKTINPPSRISGLLAMPAACFVSLKTKQGELRGCIGTIEPTENTLAEEVIANALNACTRDPRFPPVSPEELAELVYSVDVLSPPEPALFEELNPQLYGVIVEDDYAVRRGLLLPDIEGVNSAAQQVEIAARKAGIPSGAAMKLFRFSVQRFREKTATVTRSA